MLTDKSKCNRFLFLIFVNCLCPLYSLCDYKKCSLVQVQFDEKRKENQRVDEGNKGSNVVLNVFCYFITFFCVFQAKANENERIKINKRLNLNEKKSLCILTLNGFRHATMRVLTAKTKKRMSNCD